MRRHLLKSKIHRATSTSVDLTPLHAWGFPVTS
jgi:hypothetical protein